MASPGSKENQPPTSMDSTPIVDKKLDPPAPKRRRIEVKPETDEAKGFEGILERLRETGGRSPFLLMQLGLRMSPITSAAESV
jgi:hypothetical protein